MASRALRTIAMAHRHFSSKPSESAEAEDLEKDMVLDGIVGIIDPLRPDVADAVKRCQVNLHSSPSFSCTHFFLFFLFPVNVHIDVTFIFA